MIAVDFERLNVKQFSWIAACTFAVLAWIPYSTHAGPIEDLKSFSSTTRSAKGEFVQRTLRSSGSLADASNGSFAFAKPGKFRWEVKKPFEQLMVADGREVFFHDKDLNQVTIRKQGEALGSTPAAILFGSADLASSFELSDGGERAGYQWVDAKPKDKEAGFELISIGMKNGLPEAMEVKDVLGRRTQVMFRLIERNPRLEAGLFRFETPAGVEVVRQ
jgi:outer membrane lipoprotein carrier protein